ncbi:hypothetical protein L6164_001227 [Bauhinia variegata]|uniref:Uncharacterized protein n=1 Tax=Bauhinia variegata TaxID=167791 RepID=A0ACB9Q8T4_BAUVA|nr:hypothetical protein L6164_001227 [Bauhinia variegata]
MADSLVEHQPIKINAENKANEVITTLPENEGSNTNSYSKNSYFQFIVNHKRTEVLKDIALDTPNFVLEDARNFLGARAKELAPGGMLVRIMQVEENGYLSIERMELADPAPWLKHKSHKVYLIL